MIELITYFCVLVVAFLWYKAVRLHYLSSGPIWCRLIGAALIIGMALWAIFNLIENTAILGWRDAFLNVSLIFISLLSSCLMAFMLITMDRDIYFCIREK